jgi:hypothetical protein
LLLQARKNDPAYRNRVRTAFDEARRALAALDGSEEILAKLGDPFAADQLVTSDSEAQVAAQTQR